MQGRPSSNAVASKVEEDTKLSSNATRHAAMCVEILTGSAVPYEHTMYRDTPIYHLECVESGSYLSYDDG